MAIAVGGLVPVGAGLAGIVMGAEMTGGGSAPAGDGADSHFRYLSGLLLAIGLGFWSVIPDIGRRTARCRLLCAIVVVGGLGRVAGVIAGDRLGAATIAALTMELLVTPALCVWQSRVASRLITHPGARITPLG